MSTAVFELFSKLALPTAAVGNGQPSAPSAASIAPLQTSLPTEDDCVARGRDKPILIFFDPHADSQTQQPPCRKAASSPLPSSVSSTFSNNGRPPSSPPRAARPSAAATPQPVSGWMHELTALQLLYGGRTLVKSLRVTPAEDDVASGLPTAEVWADWPQSVQGWSLCLVSQLCAVLGDGRGDKASAAASTLYFFVASRYELVGTATVYERYLLLSPTHGTDDLMASVNTHGNDAPPPRTVDVPAGATSISVSELRTLRRVACLCRCYCTTGAEVLQPRASSSAASVPPSRKEVNPPPPPADYLLRLVPASLQYSFCFTTTALLSVDEEERCVGWAAATAQLGRQKPPLALHTSANGGVGKAASPHRSSSTEPANTSGALSDGGHTIYQESTTFSRDRSSSAVRVVEGAAAGVPSTVLAGVAPYSEDPRSTTSTPGRQPLPPQQQQRQRRAGSDPSKRDEEEHEEGEMPHHANPYHRFSQYRTAEDALEQRLPPSQRWRALSLVRLLDKSYYDEQVPAGWRRWRYASSGILCRPLVVDSLDGIVRYIHGSRLAFYTSVAFLDRFIAITVDPIANFYAYRRQIHRARTGQEMDFSMLSLSEDHRGNVSETLAPEQLYGDDGVHARDICGFLTQVIVVCIMLGSKTVDLYPPRIRQLMGCVEDTAPISEQEFVILELHVLLTLGFPVHPVTLFESVNALLTFSTSDELYGTLTASHTTRRLLEELQDRGHLVDDVEKLLQEQEEKDAAAAVRGGTSHSNAAAAAAEEEHWRGCASKGYRGRPTASLTTADCHAMNDWLRLRLFTYFICDEVIRADAMANASATPSSAGSSANLRGSRHHAARDRAGTVNEEVGDEEEEEEWREGCNVLQFSPVLVATASLVVAAEQLQMPLTGPLLRLLPSPLRERLQDEGSNDNVAAVSPTSLGSMAASSLRENEESKHASRVPSHPPARGTAAPHAQHGGDETLKLTARPSDDHYKVLAELSLMMEAELLRLSAWRRGVDVVPAAHTNSSGVSSSSLAREEETEKEAMTAVMYARNGEYTRAGPTSSAAAVAATCAAHLPLHDQRGLSPCARATLSRRAADSHAVEMLSFIIKQVKAIHERSRESCPPVLLQRYQPLFRDSA